MQKGLVFNPYMPFWEYVPDGEPHVFGDRLYVYGSHDRRNGDAYCLEDYVVWSAPVEDLSQWRLDGVSYRRTDDPRYAPEARTMIAPDVCQGPDGRFYLYYVNDKKTIAVAVSNVPEGPFEYHGVVHMPDQSIAMPGIAFDPGVISDERGTWLYYGFDASKFFGADKAAVSGSYAVELEDDMLTCKGAPVKVLAGSLEAKGTPFEGHAFFEASSIRRIGERYYLVYSSELGHELCYATSASPTGPFEYGGTIVSNADIGYRGNVEPTAYPANTHGGLACVGGQWYVFYHRHTHQRQYSRQACAEKIEILSDGSIPQVEMTSCGLSDRPLPFGPVYPAHIACGIAGPDGVVHLSTKTCRRANDPYLFQEGSDKNEDGDGCMYAANLWDGAELTFKYFEAFGTERECVIGWRGAGTGHVDIEALDRSGGALAIGRIELLGDADDGTWRRAAGTVKVPDGLMGIRLIVHTDEPIDIRDFCIR